MGYCIRGFIVPNSLLNTINKSYPNIIISRLNQGYCLIPLTDEFYDEVNKFEGKSEQGYMFLTDKLIEFGIKLSKQLKSNIVYIEADYFGGNGYQNASVWNNGNRTFEEFKGDQGINNALKTLDLKIEIGKDEFETIGLNKNRRIEDWLES
ncbi:hypothetical protein [Paenibacillus sp. NFR01]|uniref:hypothetical protein n=1 Tax=Paenibacillus sp. NFR01 TaxID=1566279 RepID=UPI0008D4B0A7|nr:hypothetical protein [Paenibacillus sp. NFR01]SEU33041.1 hypothetical protein SAMN03159358_0179 [Paenibacillus sp. NFR01]